MRCPTPESSLRTRRSRSPREPSRWRRSAATASARARSGCAATVPVSMKMPVPMVEPRPMAVSERAVSTRLSCGAAVQVATIDSTERTANRRRSTDMGPRAGQRFAAPKYADARMGAQPTGCGPADRSRSRSGAPQRCRSFPYHPGLNGPTRATRPCRSPTAIGSQPGRCWRANIPGSMSRAEAMERMQKLLRAGVTSFIDLTEEGELPGYERCCPSSPSSTSAISACRSSITACPSRRRTWSDPGC